MPHLFVRRTVLPAALLAFASLAFAPVAPADEKLDLDRVAPVPADHPIPIQDFFRPPLFAHPKLNSPGNWFAAEIDFGDRTGLYTYNLDTKKSGMMPGSINRELFAFTWLDESRVLTNWLKEKHFANGLYVANAERLRENYAIETFSVANIIGVPRDHPLRPVVWIRKNAYDDGNDMGVVELDATKPVAHRDDVQPGSMQANIAAEETSRFGVRASIVSSFPQPEGQNIVVSYLADKDGHLAFSVANTAGVDELLRLDHGKWLKCPVDLDKIDIIGAGDEPNQLIVVAPAEDGKPHALQRLDAASGKLGEVLLHDDAYNPTDCVLYRHPGNGMVLGVRFARTQWVTAWFNPDYQAVQKMLEHQFPNMVVEILGSNQEQSRFFVSAYSDRQPVTYYTLDLKTKTVGLIKCTSPWIDPARMQPMHIVKAKTRDGHKLEAYLTLPAGASKEHPVPMVVLPHGGPWVRDAWGYDGAVQFLVSRGYAVLQPNYRGSLTYDWAYPASDQWAFRKMHDDVTDSVKVVLGTGYIDSSRVAIMGGSFGGYLAACGAAFEPDLYRCAVTIAGVFDWAEVIKEAKSEQYTSVRFADLNRFLGNPAAHTAEFAAMSPLHHIDQVKIPILVAHGTDDPVADVAESRNLISELEKYHVPHEVMLISGEGHGMRYLKNQVALYARIEAFLAKNLAPTAAPSAAPAKTVGP